MTGARSEWSRWGIFNLVGLLGFGLQLPALFLLKHFAGLDYRLATACAVEVAVLHNFIWHEYFTWADVLSAARGGVWARLLRFHAASGFISLGGNVLLTWTMVKWTGMSYLLANAASVVICSVLNFVIGDRFVFRRRSRSKAQPLLCYAASSREHLRTR